MALTPQQYYFEFSYNYCDISYTWGSRNLKWGKGAVYDMEGWAHLSKMLPFPCYNSYKSKLDNISISQDIDNIDSLPTLEQWKVKFYGFAASSAGKLSLPYKFLQILDPDCFQEIQDSQYHSIANAIRNAADISRACDLFFKAHETNTSDPLYDWEARGATEPIYQFAKNSLIKGLISCGPNVIPTTYSNRRYSGGPNIECFPTLLGGKYGCACPPAQACPPIRKQCIPGGDWGCSEKTGRALAECAEEPYPSWPSGNAPLGSGFPFDKITDYIHAGYFLRKSYGGYGNFINKSSDSFNSTRDPKIFIRYAQQQNGFDYNRLQYNVLNEEEHYYGTNRRLPSNTVLPVKRIKSIMRVSDSVQARAFLHNGYGIVLSTNVGFSNVRDSIGLSYPDRLWYHTMAIIGCDDTRRLHPDSLFLIANSWGEWNSGGEPDWGPIPKGSFLITGTHLDCILQTSANVEKINDCNPFYKTLCQPLEIEGRSTSSPDGVGVPISDGFGGRGGYIRLERSFKTVWTRVNCKFVRINYVSERACNRALEVELKDTENCGNNCFDFNGCDFKQCGSNQQAWGIAFALSFEDNPPFKRKDMKYEQFFLDRDTPCRTPANITIEFLDENRCEDDIFDIFIQNPETQVTRLIQRVDLVSTPPGCCGVNPLTNQPCPQTKITIPVTITPQDIDSYCRFFLKVVLVGTNCCSTYTRAKIIGPRGKEIFGSYFGQSGYTQSFNLKDIL